MSDAHMTFGFSDEQRQMRASVLGLLGRVLPPSKIRQLDKAGEYPFEACQALADGGYMGLMYSPEYGGMGGSYMDLAVLGEALGYHYGGIAQAYGITVIYAGMHVALHGSEAMKREVLPKVISGDLRLALCLSEPDHGSDVAGIELAAVRDGDAYVLNGQKIYNSAAHVAHNLVARRQDQARARLRRYQHVPGRRRVAGRFHTPAERTRPAHHRGQPLLL
jgi:acyl-CoA dehydrogenase